MNTKLVLLFILLIITAFTAGRFSTENQLVSGDKQTYERVSPTLQPTPTASATESAKKNFNSPKPSSTSSLDGELKSAIKQYLDEQKQKQEKIKELKAKIDDECKNKEFDFKNFSTACNHMMEELQYLMAPATNNSSQIRITDLGNGNLSVTDSNGKIHSCITTNSGISCN